MSTVEITAGTVEPLAAYARAAAGGALTGSSNLRVQIRRVADGYFFDFNDETFKNSGWTTRQATLSEVSASNAPGEYALTGGVDTTGWDAGSYAVTFLEVSTSLVANGPQFAVGELRVVTATSSALSARIPAALVSGRIDASVGAVASNAITATAIADNAITSAKIATDAIGAAQIAAGAITSSEAPALANLDAAVTTRLASASYTAPPSAGDNATAVWGAGTRTLTGIGASGIASQASVDALPTVGGIADAVCDELISGHTTVGSVGAALGRVDVAVSTRATPSDVTAVGTAVSDVQTRLPAALVGGRMDASVGAVAAGAITASGIAADAIGASQVAASAVAEIQSGLATSSALSSVGTDASDAATRAADIQTRIPAGLVGGRMDASVGAMATDSITSAALATSAVSEIQSGLATTTNVSAVGTIAAAVGVVVDAVAVDVVDIQTRLPAALVGGRIDASVGAMAANTLTASALAADAVAEITAGVGAAVWATAVSAPASGTFGWYVQRVFQLGFNRLELDSVGGGRNVLYDDDASTVIATFTLRDVTGGSLTLTSGAPARRGAGAAP